MSAEVQLISENYKVAKNTPTKQRITNLDLPKDSAVDVHRELGQNTNE